MSANAMPALTQVAARRPGALEVSAKEHVGFLKF
jgi:hypothetical protein